MKTPTYFEVIWTAAKFALILAVSISATVIIALCILNAFN